MEICTWVVYWGEVTVGGRGHQAVVGKKEDRTAGGLGCHTVATEVSASATWSTEAGVAFRVIPNRDMEVRPLHPRGQSLDVGYPLEKGCVLAIPRDGEQ